MYQGGGGGGAIEADSLGTINSSDSESIKITVIPFNGDAKEIILAGNLTEYKALCSEKQVSYLHDLIEKEFAIQTANQRLSIQIGDPRRPTEQWKKRTVWTDNQTLAEINLTPNSIINVMFKLSENLDETDLFAQESSDDEQD